MIIENVSDSDRLQMKKIESYYTKRQMKIRLPELLYKRIQAKALFHDVTFRELYEAALLACLDWDEIEVRQHIPPLPSVFERGTSRYYQNIRALRKKWTKWVTGVKECEDDDEALGDIEDEIVSIYKNVK